MLRFRRFSVHKRSAVLLRIPNILRITVRFRTSPLVTCVNRHYSKYVITQKAVRSSKKINTKWPLKVNQDRVFWGQWKGDKGLNNTIRRRAKNRGHSAFFRISKKTTKDNYVIFCTHQSQRMLDMFILCAFAHFIT